MSGRHDLAVGRPALERWSQVTVGDVMSRRLVKVPVTAELRHVRRAMNLENVRHVAVVDAHGELIGIVSDRDVLRARAEEGRNSLPVADFMTRRVVAVTEDARLIDADHLLLERRFSALPVEGEQARVVGIVTETDMLLVLQAMLAGRAPEVFVTGL